MTEPFTALIDELRASEETLTPSLRERIFAEGTATVPSLIEALLDDEDEDGEGGGWASIHAVNLLVDLKAEAAIVPMLRVLAETDWDFIIHDRIVLRLPELGPPVLEPALSMLAGETPSEPFAEGLCAILSQLGVRDERVFEHLAARFLENPEMGSAWLADYGDERGVPLLEKELLDFVAEPDDRLALVTLRDLVESYERLAGPLTDDLREHVADLTARWHAARATASTARTTARSIKIGRNDPCPCGSGKKYKRCHLGAEGGVAT